MIIGAETAFVRIIFDFLLLIKPRGASVGIFARNKTFAVLTNEKFFEFFKRLLFHYEAAFI